MTLLAHVLTVPGRAYYLLLSPWVGYGSRYQPTCSAFALGALERHGSIIGGWLTLRRLGRYHRWGKSGFDPVPGSDPSLLPHH